MLTKSCFINCKGNKFGVMEQERATWIIAQDFYRCKTRRIISLEEN